MTTRGLPLQQRFEMYVSPEPNSGCHLWMGFGTNTGYGRMAINSQPVAAHRLAYEFYCGSIPDGMHVLHKCDVRCCVNPEHLFLGTNADNVLDKVAKGRQATAWGGGSPKLNWGAVEAIRSSDLSTIELGERFGVSATAIGHVRQGKTWNKK